MKLFILILSVLLFTTCRSDINLECTEKNTVKIIPHAMDFFFFKTGSWWVYEEEKTGERDSIWIGSHNIETSNAAQTKAHCKCGKGKCIQMVRTQFRSKKAKGEFLYGYLLISGLEEKGEHEVMEGNGIYDNRSGYRITYSDNKYNTESPTSGIYEDLESITVKDKTYKDILHHYYKQQDNIPDWQHEAWYARNIYLVKFRLFDGTTWNLVKYNIVK